MKRNPTRELVAQLAAQLMYEHGMRDFSAARRKAARKLGIVDTHHLPGNEEIEAAIREYHAVFHADTHPQWLRQLRTSALQTMHMLSGFDPYLTGSVLDGSAGRHSDIDIELFTDNEKDVEMYLLNHNIPFRQADCGHRHGRRPVPCFILNGTLCDIRVSVRPADAVRHAARAAGELSRRASMTQLASLLAQETPDSASA